MRSLTSNESFFVSGGIAPEYVSAAVAGLVGGYVAYRLMKFCGPLSTTVGVVGLGVAGAIICFPVAPPLGSIVGGSIGAIAGYFCSATLANAAAFCLGAVITGSLTHYRVNVT